MTEDEYRRRKENKMKKRRKALIIKTVILCILVVVLIIAVWFAAGGAKRVTSDVTGRTSASGGILSDSSESESSSSSTETTTGGSTSQEQTEIAANAQANQRADLLSQAVKQAQQYDYEGAIATLESIADYDTDAEVMSLIADYQTQNSNLVAVSPDQVTHIFFHSLVVDTARGFSLTGDEGWDSATVGFCEWMTTVYEFDQIMQQMYDRGYVLVSIYDLIDEYTDENGVTHVTGKNIYLPQGKTPFVLSLDDLSYYHSYDGRGTASKMIIGEDGTPTCEYIDADGNTLVGSYDCVPRLDDFIDEHPDFSYKGAKGTIALTGYDGIFGYRTDYCYRDRVELTSDQEAWLNANPNYNWETECAQAKAVADCIKADGWTFASHTWGHINVYDASLESMQTDAEKWKNYVETLIGDTDIVIYAHGADMSSWDEVYDQSDKFALMKSYGFNIFCNVDSAQYFVQIGDTYLRMGRRNLDGYRIWMAVYGGDDLISDLVDASTVIDPTRPTDASLYSL